MDWGSLTELNEVEQLTQQANFALNMATEFESEIESTIERFKERRSMQVGA